MLGCTQADGVEDISVEEMVERRLAEFGESFGQKMTELDEVFKSVGERQSRIENLSKIEQNQAKKLVEDSYNTLHEHLENVSQNTVREFEVRFEVREKVFNTEIKTFSKRMDGYLGCKRIRIMKIINYNIS